MLLIILRVQAAWEKLNRLEEVRFQVNLDLQDKRETLEIDRENLNLDRTCASISYKPNALRTPKKYADNSFCHNSNNKSF